MYLFNFLYYGKGINQRREKNYNKNDMTKTQEQKTFLEKTHNQKILRQKENINMSKKETKYNNGFKVQAVKIYIQLIIHES